MLVKFFAAEGVLQGHKVFVVLGGDGGAGAGAGTGAAWGERWGRDLPGLAAAGKKHGDVDNADDDDGSGGGGRGRGRGGVGSKEGEEAGGGYKREKMKIAWRYERLGEFGGGGGGLAAGSRGTKYVSFPVPVLSSLVHIAKKPKKSQKRLYISDSFLCKIVLFCFFIYVWKERANRPPKSLPNTKSSSAGALPLEPRQ